MLYVRPRRLVSWVLEELAIEQAEAEESTTDAMPQV